MAMKTTSIETAPAKSPRKSKFAVLLEQAQQDLAAVRAQLAQTDETLAATRKERDAIEHSLSEKNETLAGQVAALKLALKPIGEKTADWTWPDPNITIWGKLTWGELRAAAEAYRSLT